MTARTYRPWSHVEDLIIHQHRADGRVAIKAELRKAGYDRSLDQINGRIKAMSRHASTAHESTEPKANP